MKLFVVACFVLVASASAGFVAPSAAAVVRQRRDVSELPAYSYLPPQLKMAEMIEEEQQQPEMTTAAAAAEEMMTEEPSSAALGENGYEYRTVRRLKYRYRSRRDVSHLAQQYLPPSNEYLPPADDSETVQAAVPKVANEYLPPSQEEVSTEAPAVAEEPTEEAAAPAEESAAPAEESAAEEEAPQDTAVLAKDGYHYKQPIVVEEMPQEPQQAEEEMMPEEEAAPKMGNLNAEYLPPQEGEAVIVEEVAPQETAVLAKDGYHYRAVRRFRL